MAKQKFVRNSADVTADNGEITFVAARNTENMNGMTYDIKSLQVQNSDGDYQTLTTEPQSVSIPLMVDHSDSVRNKIGSIDEAHIENVAGVDQAVMHAKFFDGTEAQEVRQRVLDGQLSDVSITTDFGTDEDAWETGNLENAKTVEVSIVYAGAESKAKIFAKNSIDTKGDSVDKDESKSENKDEATNEPTLDDAQLDTLATKVAEKLKENNTEAEEETEAEETNEEKESEMAEQETNAPATGEKVASKVQVMNSLAKLAKNGAIRGMNRNEVVEAVKNAVTVEDSDGSTYTVPDAVFTEILQVTKPTDILGTFRTLPVGQFTLMQEQKSDDDLARAGKWSKDDKKKIQKNTIKAQKFDTDFLYKLQEISYSDLKSNFGNILLAYIHNELPQKTLEEEERAFIVGDGRSTGTPDRHVTAVVSLKSAAADSNNTHVYKYDGTGDSGRISAVMNGIAKLGEEGTLYAVMNKTTLTAFRQAGLSAASGLPFSADVVAGALGVETIFTREYVDDDVVYVWTNDKVIRLTGDSDGETIEQYDIDYNNRKIEYIRQTGGGASGIYSAVKVSLPTAVSA